MVVLTIAIGARPREPRFGGSATRRAARPDLERRHRRPDRHPRHVRPRRRRVRPARAATSASTSPGKFSLRVAVARGARAGRRRRSPPTASRSSTTRPAATSQELLRINSATIVFPKLGVTRLDPAVRPERRATTSTDPARRAGIIPGLVVRGNGFTLGVAELRHRRRRLRRTARAATATAGDGKIRLGSILEFDDIRIGVQNFSVTFGHGPSTSTARSTSPPAAPSSSRASAFSVDDHRPQDRRRPQPRRHAERRGDPARS